MSDADDITSGGRKVCTKCGECKEFSAFSKRPKNKDGIRSECKACNAAYRLANIDRIKEKDKAYGKKNAEALRKKSAAYRAENAEKIKAYQAEYRAKNIARRREYLTENSDRFRAAYAEYYAKNADRMRKKSSDYSKNNPDKRRAYRAEYYAATIERRREYVEANKDKWRLQTAKRRAAQSKRTPPWADMGLISAVYRFAKHLEYDGVKLHVDHIVPLNGKTASGLHTHHNLRVITESENKSKCNAVTGDEYEIEPEFVKVEFKEFIRRSLGIHRSELVSEIQRAMRMCRNKAR